MPCVRHLPRCTDCSSRPYEEVHRALARRAAEEGIILLKNENHTLPLPSGCRIALYGTGALHTLKGGTGSGDVNARETVSIRDGLYAAGFQIARPAANGGTASGNSWKPASSPTFLPRMSTRPFRLPPVRLPKRPAMLHCMY